MKDSGFEIARSFIEVSEIDPAQREDTFNVAFARAGYMKFQRVRGDKIEPYEGRNPGIINLAAESILVELDKIQNPK